ncbi:hypothetical protein ACFROC_21915, partial [Nocardia tengchongensis]|uniref:hypothetical protein n=1 Tax=Nocardia tengchongensis TaxID=2055889 RepID=UPI0036BD765D
AHGGTAVGALLAGALVSVLGTTVTGWILVAAVIVLARRARHITDPGPPPPTAPNAPPLSPQNTRPPANWIAALSHNSDTKPNPEDHHNN